MDPVHSIASSDGRRSERAGVHGERLPNLVALRAAVSNGALRAERLPDRIKILNWGDNPSTKGNVRVGQRSLELLEGNQRRFGFERVAIDFNHCTIAGSPEQEKLLKAGQSPIVFGYGRPYVVAGEGLFLDDVRWTPEGQSQARRFEDLSPAANFDSGEVEFVHSVALTTNGCLYDVTFFSAEPGKKESGHESVPETKNMSEEKKGQLDAANIITVAEMAPIVGLAATASKADVLGKLGVLSILGAFSGLVKDGKVLIVDTLSALDARVKAIETAATKSIALLSATVDGKTTMLSAEDLVRLAGRVSAVEAALKEQAAAGTKSECGKIITLLSMEGKAPVNPGTGKAYTADELKGLDVSTLRLLQANTPATVPLSARGRLVQEGKPIDPKLKGRARFLAAQEEINWS